MKLTLLSTLFLWAAILALANVFCGCSQSFPIGRGHQVDLIKIEPDKGEKRVYKVERNV